MLCMTVTHVLLDQYAVDPEIKIALVLVPSQSKGRWVVGGTICKNFKWWTLFLVFDGFSPTWYFWFRWEPRLRVCFHLPLIAPLASQIPDGHLKETIKRCVDALFYSDPCTRYLIDMPLILKLRLPSISASQSKGRGDVGETCKNCKWWTLVFGFR